MKTDVTLPIKAGLEPIADDRSRILILGSLPGDASLAAQEYYANPRNHFWPILSRIYNQPINDDYRSKLAFLHQNGIALWDVLKAAERKGSLDSNIRSKDVNDLQGLIRNHPQIRAIGLNGTKAWKIFKRYCRNHTVFSEGDVHVPCLPSSSPVPGRNVKPFEEKVDIWGDFLGLVS